MRLSLVPREIEQSYLGGVLVNAKPKPIEMRGSYRKGSNPRVPPQAHLHTPDVATASAFDVRPASQSAADLQGDYGHRADTGVSRKNMNSAKYLILWRARRDSNS